MGTPYQNISQTFFLFNASANDVLNDTYFFSDKSIVKVSQLYFIFLYSSKLHASEKSSPKSDR